MTLRSYVSNHAIVRWIERVELISTRAARNAADSADDAHVVDVLSRMMDIDDIVRKIATPTVIAAIEAGACSVILHSIRLAIKNGKVVTVTPTDTKEAERKFRLVRDNGFNREDRAT